MTFKLNSCIDILKLLNTSNTDSVLKLICVANKSKTLTARHIVIMVLIENPDTLFCCFRTQTIRYAIGCCYRPMITKTTRAQTTVWLRSSQLERGQRECDVKLAAKFHVKAGQKKGTSTVRSDITPITMAT